MVGGAAVSHFILSCSAFVPWALLHHCDSCVLLWCREPGHAIFYCRLLPLCYLTPPPSCRLHGSPLTLPTRPRGIALLPRVGCTNAAYSLGGRTSLYRVVVEPHNVIAYHRILTSAYPIITILPADSAFVFLALFLLTLPTLPFTLSPCLSPLFHFYIFIYIYTMPHIHFILYIFLPYLCPLPHAFPHLYIHIPHTYIPPPTCHHHIFPLYTIPFFTTTYIPTYYHPSLYYIPHVH